MIKQSDQFRENAENCLHLAEAAEDEPRFLRYKRMAAAWIALAVEQDWLDGEKSVAEGADTLANGPATASPQQVSQQG